MNTYTNVTNEGQIIKVYRLHDNAYLSQAEAAPYQDGKDIGGTWYIYLQAGETIESGTQIDNFPHNKTREWLEEDLFDD